jgi:hypothetical protein
MGRILMVLTVWLVMAAMMLLIALPVIAKNRDINPDDEGPPGPPNISGSGHPGTSSDVIHSDEGACVVHQGTTTGKTTGGGCVEETT